MTCCHSIHEETTDYNVGLTPQLPFYWSQIYFDGEYNAGLGIPANTEHAQKNQSCIHPITPKQNKLKKISITDPYDHFKPMLSFCIAV